MPRIKILGTAITATHGTLSTGDILNVSDDFAAHLVNDCRVADYLDVIEPVQPETPEAPEAPEAPETPETPETPEAQKTSRKTPKQAFDDAEKFEQVAE